jgi:hypothetical protein
LLSFVATSGTIKTAMISARLSPAARGRDITCERTDKPSCRRGDRHPPGTFDDVMGTDACPVRPRVRFLIVPQHAARQIGARKDSARSRIRELTNEDRIVRMVEQARLLPQCRLTLSRGMLDLLPVVDVDCGSVPFLDCSPFYPTARRESGTSGDRIVSYAAASTLCAIAILNGGRVQRRETMTAPPTAAPIIVLN